MEFKGTKGNWDYVYENNKFEVYNEPETNGDFIIIAICENKANALLISKAPEMLEMLIDAVNENKNNQPLSEGWFNAVEKIIKEATEL